MAKVRIAILVLLLSLQPVRAAEPPGRSAVPDSDIDARVQQVIDRVRGRAEMVGLSVAVGRGSRLLAEHGVGVADIESGAPANAQTIFRIGSITKQYTAAGIMKLVERGKLGLDDDLRRHVTAFDTGGRTVTIRQLLNHTSGIPSYTSQPTFFAEGSSRDLSHEQLLGFVKGVPFDFEPGKGWNYSNTGYYLLGMVIEAVDGRPYARFVQEEFFTPLGLTRTRYGSEREVIRNRAQGYGIDPATGRQVNDALISMNTPGAAGALSASAGDLVRWQIALTQGRAITAASFDAMIGSSVPNLQGRGSYGFGLEISERDGRRRVSHGGGIPGFNSQLIWLPDEDVHVAVVSNSEALPSGVVAELLIRAATSSAPLPDERTTAAPGSEAALRRLVAGVIKGEPDYDAMSPQFAAVTRQQLPMMQRHLQSLGPLESVTFASVDLQGADIYNLRFAKGPLIVRIALGEQDKIVGANVRQGVAPVR
jgi:CubicO group peptidase (beta-lactamase class C family)